jgi:hypothetical protein
VTVVALAAAILALGCESGEEREARCIGPLVDLMRWRDAVEADRILRGKVNPALAAEEARRVDEVVAKLTPLRRSCELTWSLQLYPEADNPGLQVRNRALHVLLRLPEPSPVAPPAGTPPGAAPAGPDAPPAAASGRAPG